VSRDRSSSGGSRTRHAAAGDGRRRSILIGLTGPIGCGKTTVAGWLADRGAAVIDADQLARAILEPGEPALTAVIEAFGPSVLDDRGRLDRAALAGIVFTDPSARKRLEAITSPAVRPRIDAALADARTSGTAIVVLEAIRLVEAGYAEVCDEVWLVTCDAADQWARLAARGMDLADAEARIAAQVGLEARVRPHATRVIDTSGDRSATERLVDEALTEASTAAWGSDAARP
jgi:dephospho-CoA kinase